MHKFSASPSLWCVCMVGILRCQIYSHKLLGIICTDVWTLFPTSGYL